MLLLIAEYLGIAAFAASGFYIAVRRKLDLLGIYLSAFLTALGGGILRDLLADRLPYSLTHSLPSVTVIVVTTLLIWRRMHQHPWESQWLFVFVDALGMVSFAISGALVGLAAGFNLAGVTLLAFTTAVGGGILRDVLINQVPYVLRGGFYGIIALGIGGSVWLLHTLGWDHSFFLTLLFLGGVTLRMIAYRRRWALPRL
ncbi:trimeric intracellular cation channel family protein [Nitratifractor sp.]|uniref:trimeric intracellular cation channel family protein n=1 Tax=Nitratifractor sp. TaxID=2268144 RepID=UPI0025D42F5A|nr:trimeric intracellular cation channel family protein [Nitratifractor sp.]